MSNWTERKPDYRQSELIVPFCPYCHAELDSLDMHNSISTCLCGEWAYTWALPMKTQYRPFKRTKVTDLAKTSAPELKKGKT